MTARGSVTQELWSRLALLGYFVEDAAPEALGNGVKQHRLTEQGERAILFFLGAAQAYMNDRKGDTKALRAFCESYAKMDTFHLGLKRDLLVTLRDLLLRGAQDKEGVEGDGPSQIWRAYAVVGAFEAAGPGRRKVSEHGFLVAPFIMDRLLAERAGALRH
ncbi:MAG: hypothetical protein AAFY59_10135 [Pseudomonadota bacterium]